jgi:hypothetical protein
MMARTQITLDPEQHRRARQRAAALGISLAEYVRRLVARDVAGTHRVVDASAVFDLGESSEADVSSHKDAYVAAAITSRRRLAAPKARSRSGPR